MMEDLVKLTFDGRASRGTFIGMLVGAVVLSFGGGFAGGFISVFGFFGGFLGFLLASVASLAGAWLAVSGTVKRFHDLGQTGWLTLLGLVPLVNLFVLVYLLLTPGQMKDNSYGFAP